MAEYIDRAKTQAYLYNNMMWYDEEGYIAEDSEKDKALWSLVNGIPTADVIGRSEYDKMVKSFKTMVEMKNENLIAMRDKYYTLEKEYAELKVNIKKAIEEIEQVKSVMNEEIIEHDKKDLITFIKGINQCLIILKENIGE